MRRLLLFAILAAIPSLAQAQSLGYIGGGAGGAAGGGGGLLDGTLCTDDDGFLVRTASGTCAIREIENTDGLVIVNGAGTAGNVGLAVDFSFVGRFSSSTADATGNCSPGTFHLRTDTNESWFCNSTNTWVKNVNHGQDSIAGADWFIDEDSFATNSATRVPSQQSVKAYVDASAGGSGTDLSDTTQTTFHDEFGAGLGTTGNIGDLSWTLTQIAAAGTVTAVATSEANHPGLIDMDSGATDNGGPYLTGGTVDDGDYASEDWEMNWIVKPDDPTTSTYISIGLSGGSPVAATSAIRAVYDSDHSHATWIFQICDSDTTGCQSAGDDTNADTHASTKVPTEDVWQRIRIRRATSGVGGNPTIYFSVGDAGAMETEITFCSAACDSTMANLPTALLAIRISVVARAAAAAKSLLVDYMHMNITGQARY